MKHRVLILTACLAAGCASGPRAFDGVLGYRTETVPEGTRVIYVDEARVGREETLAKVSAVCAARSGSGKGRAGVQVTAETEYVTQVNVSVPMSMGATPTGDVRHGAQSGGHAISQATTTSQSLQRDMKVRKIEALCTRAAP